MATICLDADLSLNKMCNIMARIVGLLCQQYGEPVHHCHQKQHCSIHFKVVVAMAKNRLVLQAVALKTFWASSFNNIHMIYKAFFFCNTYNA